MTANSHPYTVTIVELTGGMTRSHSFAERRQADAFYKAMCLDAQRYGRAITITLHEGTRKLESY